MVIALLLFTYDTTQASMPRVAVPKSYHVKSAPCKTLGRAMNGWNSSPARAIWPERWPWLSTKPFVSIWLTMTRKHIGLISWTLPTLQGSRSLVSLKYVARYGPPQLDLRWTVELLFLGHNSMNFQSRHKAEASYPCRTTWKTGRLWGSFWTKMRILQQDEHWNICTFSMHCHRGGRVPVSKYWQHADGEDWFIIYRFCFPVLQVIKCGIYDMAYINIQYTKKRVALLPTKVAHRFMYSHPDLYKF